MTVTATSAVGVVVEQPFKQKCESVEEVVNYDRFYVSINSNLALLGPIL